VATRQGHRWLRTNIEAAEADLAEVDGRFWHVEVEILVLIWFLLELNFLSILIHVSF
jgi:hypothetical protein